MNTAKGYHQFLNMLHRVAALQKSTQGRGKICRRKNNKKASIR